MKFLLFIIVLNIFLTFVLHNPGFFLMMFIVLVAYYAITSYQRYKKMEDFQQQYYQNDTYQNTNQNHSGDVIDVEYTEKDIDE